MKDHIASRIRMGDEQAFDLLFRIYYVRLCSFSNKYQNNPEGGRDIVQEIFG
jgi:DNA-directed RNA polymerase specialized sigma24 family protein